jgi:Fe-S cluster biogenesis protein NfuA
VILQGACSGCPSSTFTLKRNRKHAKKHAKWWKIK